MNERLYPINYYIAGTLSGNHTLLVQSAYPLTFVDAHASASNDSSATIALSGASTMSIAAQAIGDSGAMSKIVPTAAEKASTAGEPADSLITVTLDYDGASGTAAENVSVILNFLVGG